MSKYNLIFIQDEQGIGVQVGEEKIYIDDQLKHMVWYELSDKNELLNSQIRALDNENAYLRKEIEKAKDLAIRFNVIKALMTEDSY